MSDMHLFTTAYHWTSSVRVGMCDVVNVRPAVISSHFADLNGSFATALGLRIGMSHLLGKVAAVTMEKQRLPAALP